MTPPPVGVLGAGSWGTALALHAASVGREVVLWARHAAVADELERERRNDRYLPGVELAPSIRATAVLGELEACDPVLVVVPSHGLREVVRAFLAAVPAVDGRALVSATKGIELDGHARMSEVIAQEALAAGRRPRIASLSGPTFADELARGVPSAAVIAAADEATAEALCATFASPRFRLYSSTDLVGVELGGTTKNVIAIGAGMIEGLGLGQNTRAALITRGLREIVRLGEACGGRAETFSGLAGLGDLVLTCTGGSSRNLRAGIALGRGETLAEVQEKATMVAEGLINTRAVARLAADLGVEMPITEQMKAVIYGGKAPMRAIEELMTRDLKAETE